MAELFSSNSLFAVVLTLAAYELGSFCQRRTGLAVCNPILLGAVGVAAVLGSLFVGLMAQRFRLRWLALVFVGLGLCLLPAGLVFRLPLNTLGVYLVLLLAFCAGQFGCSLFSTCAVSVIQARTPDHLMGKVMACVFTLSMCAQPVGQIVYGALFDWFARSPGWVLIPSGLLVCAIGCLSARFFLRLESH